MNNMNFVNFINALNNMNNNMKNNMNNSMNNNMNDMINFMNQMNNNMNINNLNNNMNYNDIINNININLNNINNNMNNIITSMNNINKILLSQQIKNYTPINFIKEIINQNIQMANQISNNNNIINLTINNPLFFPSQNNINIMKNQIPNLGVLPRQERIGIDDFFPGNNNRRINITFINPNNTRTNIITPVNIKVKELFLAYAKKMKVNPKILGKEIFFLFNNHKININEDKDIISFGLENGNKIVVLQSQIIIGGI